MLSLVLSGRKSTKKPHHDSCYCLILFIWFPNPLAPRSEPDHISQLPMIIYHGAPRSLQNFTVTIVTITLDMAISFAVLYTPTWLPKSFSNFLILM